MDAPGWFFATSALVKHCTEARISVSGVFEGIRNEVAPSLNENERENYDETKQLLV